MIKKIKKENINTVEYVDRIYSQLNWDNVEYGQSHLKKDVELLTEEYKKHLDVGCCDGLFTKLYLEKFPNTQGYGIDHSMVSIDRAQMLCPTGKFISGDLYKLPFENDFFDFVHSAQTIEHLENPYESIKEMLRVLKKNGTFVLTTVNEFASDDPEHLWKWDLSGVKSLIPNNYTTKREFDKFFNGHMLYIMGEKI